MFTDGSIIRGDEVSSYTFAGVTTGSGNSGAVNTVQYRPNFTVQDLSRPFILSRSLFTFTATATISNVRYNSAILTLSNINSSYPLSSNDEIVIANTVTGIERFQRYPIRAITDPTTLSFRITLNQTTTYSLTAYYVFNGSPELQSPVFIPTFTTPVHLRYDHTQNPATTSYSATLSNFVYNGVPMTGVFGSTGAGQSISISVYTPYGTPPIKYTTSSSVSNVANFTIASLPPGVQSGTLSVYDLKYIFINDLGEFETYSRTGLIM